jgi:hypothetical protein
VAEREKTVRPLEASRQAMAREMANATPEARREMESMQQLMGEASETVVSASLWLVGLWLLQVIHLIPPAFIVWREKQLTSRHKGR